MSGSSEQVDVGDAALENLLNEADALMNGLKTDDNGHKSSPLVIEGFSIDSDDEGEGETKNAKVEAVEDHPLSHPLSDEFLASHDQNPAPNAASSSTTNFQQFPSVSTPTMASNGMQADAVQMAMSGATMDNFKQQTSRFASNLASMAQRAASQVAAAAAPVQVTGGPAMSQSTSFPGQSLIGSPPSETI